MSVHKLWAFVNLPEVYRRKESKWVEYMPVRKLIVSNPDQPPIVWNEEKEMWEHVDAKT